MNIIQVNQFQIIAFILVLLRCLGFFLSWPLFSGNSVPIPVKILLSLLVSMVCFAIIDPVTYPKVLHYQSLIALSVKEMILGYSMGFLTSFIFHTVAIAGEFISMAMGLSAAQIFNPALNMQQSSVNQLFFLAIGKNFY